MSNTTIVVDNLGSGKNIWSAIDANRGSSVVVKIHSWFDAAQYDRNHLMGSEALGYVIPS